MLVERDRCNARGLAAVWMDVPGVESRISGHMRGKVVQRQYGPLIEGPIIGDIVLIERYLPDNRKIGKSDVKPLYKPLEMILKKTA